MGSPIPVQIGSYCSDFVIQDPPSVTGPKYYRRIEATTNQTYYLTVNNAGGYLEVEDPITWSSSPTYINSDFRLTLYWDKFIRLCVDGSTIVPLTDIRYVGSERHGLSGENIVKLNTDGSIMLREKSGTGLVSYRDTTTTTFRTYLPTDDPPYYVERGGLVYLVNDDDDNASVITPSTRLRYLTLNLLTTPLTSGSVLETNLFRPSVTESMIRRTGYRINKRTRIDNNSVSYSFDAFRGDPATTTSTTRYLEVNRVLTNFTFNTEAGDVVGTSATNFIGTKITYGATNSKYVATSIVFDKSISDLYGDFSLGLFKLFYNTETNLYLGYDCVSPTSTGTCSTSKQLVMNDYYQYRSPVLSCQFRLYDIGDNEYMIFVTDPDDSNKKFILKPTQSGTITYTTASPVKEERGWIFEEVDKSKNTVRLKWNYDESPVPTGGSYLKIVTNTPSMDTLANSNIFVCIRCSRVDPATGTCAPNTSIYVDDDMNFATSPVLMSPVPLGKAQIPSEVNKLTSRMKIVNEDDQTQLEVSDDGVVSFVRGTGSTLFTSDTGILSLQEKRRGILFIGKVTSDGKNVVYAKYTAADGIKFVAATNPSVADGFGWVIENHPTDNSRKRITSASSTSPVPLKQTATSYLTILTDLSITRDLTYYDVDSNKFRLFIEYLGPENAGMVSAQTSTTKDSGYTTSNEFGADGKNGNINVLAKPGNIWFIIGLSSGTVLEPFAFNIPESMIPVPVVTRSPERQDNNTNIVLKNAIVTNMNTSGTVRVTVRQSTGSPIPPQNFTYSDISSSTGVRFTGLTPVTTYSSVDVEFTNTLTNKKVSVTLTGFTTTSSFAASTNESSYDVQTDTYTVTFRNYIENTTISSVQQSTSRTGTFTGVTLETNSAGDSFIKIRATSPRSPVTSPPASPQQTQTLFFRATLNDGTITEVVPVTIPEAQNPFLTTPPSQTTSSTSIALTGASVTNMNTSGVVTVSLRQTNGSPIPPQNFTYSDISGGGITVSGLIPNTDYSAPAITIRNSLNNKFLGFSLTAFRTLAFVLNAAYMNSGAENRPFFLRVGGTYFYYDDGTYNYTWGRGFFPTTTTKKHAMSFSVGRQMNQSENQNTNFDVTGYRLIRFNSTGNLLRHANGRVHQIDPFPDPVGRSFNGDFAWRFLDSTSGTFRIQNPIASPGSRDRFFMKIDDNQLRAFEDQSDNFNVDLVPSVISASYLNSGADGFSFYLKVAGTSDYVRMPLNNNNPDDSGNRFWRTSNKSESVRFYVDNGKIGLAHYNQFVRYTGNMLWLTRDRGRNDWIYKTSGTTDTSFSFEVGSASDRFRIRPTGSTTEGLGFVTDPTDNNAKLRIVTSGFTEFNIEF